MVLSAAAVSLALFPSHFQASAERQQVFRWLDSVGYGFATAPFVEITTPGHWSSSTDEAAVSGDVSREYGFLIRDERGG